MKTTSTFHLVLGGDIRRSRELPDRTALQQRLENALWQVNDGFSSSLSVPLTVVQGDAFQGLLSRADQAVPLIVALEQHLAPATFRTGLGWGSLSTDMRNSTASMDGAAFHLAHEALDLAREDDRWLVVRGLPPTTQPVADGLTALLGAVRRGWTPSQLRAVMARRRHETGKDAAAAIAVSPPALSRALKAAHYNEVLEAEAALGQLLAQGTGAGS